MFISCKRNLRTFPSVKATQVLVSFFLGGGEQMERSSDSAGGETQIFRAGVEAEYFVGSERFVSAAPGTENCQSTKKMTPILRLSS